VYTVILSSGIYKAKILTGRPLANASLSSSRHLPSHGTQLYLPGSQPTYTPTVHSPFLFEDSGSTVAPSRSRFPLPHTVVPSQHVPRALEPETFPTAIPSQLHMQRHVSPTPTHVTHPDHIIHNELTPSTPLPTHNRITPASGRQTVGAKPTKSTTRHQDTSDDDDELKFELVMWAIKPVKAVMAVRHKKSKTAKVEPITFGPADADTGIEWESFLEILADLLEMKPLLLVVHSFEWRWLKPANSPWLPLRAPSAYESLIRQLRAPPKNVSGSYIIIRMEQPLQQPVDHTKVCAQSKLSFPCAQ